MLTDNAYLSLIVIAQSYSLSGRDDQLPSVPKRVAIIPARQANRKAEIAQIAVFLNGIRANVLNCSLADMDAVAEGLGTGVQNLKGEVNRLFNGHQGLACQFSGEIFMGFKLTAGDRFVGRISESEY